MSIIPLPYKLAAGAALLAGALGWSYTLGHRAGSQSADLELARERLAGAQAAQQAEETYRAEDTRRTEATQEITRHAQIARTHVDADAAVADAEHLRLLDAYRAASRRPSTGDPGSADRGQTARAATDVRTDVFGGVDETAGILAAALDRAHGAGIVCEQFTDALSGADKSSMPAR